MNKNKWTAHKKGTHPMSELYDTVLEEKEVDGKPTTDQVCITRDFETAEQIVREHELSQNHE